MANLHVKAGSPVTEDNKCVSNTPASELARDCFDNRIINVDLTLELAMPESNPNFNWFTSRLREIILA